MWFELYQEGWAQQASRRSLAALLYEAIQNAFDQRVTRVMVSLGPETIVVEDDGAEGIADPELAYTLFLTQKGASPQMRGRYGRGLKELLSVMRSASIETVGFTLHFDEHGRRVEPSRRKSGTRLTLRRHTSAEALREAAARLAMLIPPPETTVEVNGRRIKRPRVFATLRGARLPTVTAEKGLERVIAQSTSVHLYQPRSGELPHVFEMGLPIEPCAAPWHIDVGQRIPLSEQRNRLDESYRQQLWCLLFDALVEQDLSAAQLQGDWVSQALASGKLRPQAIEAYVRRVFPSMSVLPSSPLEDDRAQQAGAHVVELSGLSHGVRAALAAVLETSEQFNRRRQQQVEEVRAHSPHEQRTVSFLKHLAKLILGKPVKITLVRQAAVEGIIESATFDRKRCEMRINVVGKMNLRSPLEPHTLGIFFHELAHAYTAEHDLTFIGHLEQVAGRGAQILAQQGAELAERYGVPFEG